MDNIFDFTLLFCLQCTSLHLSFYQHAEGLLFNTLGSLTCYATFSRMDFLLHACSKLAYFPDQSCIILQKYFLSTLDVCSNYFCHVESE